MALTTIETGIPLVTEDTITVANDYVLFLDGSATGNANKEQFSDVMTLIAGTGLSASSGVLNVDASQGHVTTVGVLGAGSIDTGFGTINNAAAITGTVITATTNFAGALTGNVTGNVSGTAPAGSLTGTTLSSSVVTSSITTVGALQAGSITSGFTSIDVGSGTIDTTGAVTTGTLAAGGNLTMATDTDVILGEAGKVNFADVAPDDGEATGLILSFIADVSLAIGDLVFIVADGSDGKVGKADANTVTTMPAIGVAVTAVSADAPVEVLVQGLLRRNSAYGFTIGQDLFVSAAAVAGVTATAPTGSGDTVQKVGVALHADIAYYNFNTTEVLLA